MITRMRSIAGIGKSISRSGTESGIRLVTTTTPGSARRIIRVLVLTVNAIATVTVIATVTMMVTVIVIVIVTVTIAPRKVVTVTDTAIAEGMSPSAVLLLISRATVNQHCDTHSKRLMPG